MRLAHRTAAAAMVALLAASCQAPGSATDKAGSAVTTVRLATIDAVDNNGQSFGPRTFVQALEDVSGGRLRVEVDVDTFGNGDASDEKRLVEAIADGSVDGGWPSARAFAGAGLSGLEALEAPLVLTSYDAQRELVTSPVAQALLDRLSGTGLVGLALAVGPLRRPFASGAPLLGPADWAGQPFRSYGSPVQDATVRALGGQPRHVGLDWQEAIRSGALRGIEMDVVQYWFNGMTTQAGHVTSDVVLWPKVHVLSVSERFWAGLGDQQRQWVADAAERARAASVEGAYDEAPATARLCALGVQFVPAGESAVAALRVAVQPVVDSLADDPLLPDLVRIGSSHPTDAVRAPATCPTPSPTAPASPS